MRVRSSQRLFDPEWPSGWVEIYEERISGRGGLKLWTLSIHEERAKYHYLCLSVSARACLQTSLSSNASK